MTARPHDTRAVPIALAAAFAIVAPTAAQERAAPSIVVILADDLGWSDIGCYGSEIETPVLDGLAAGGLRFTQFYNGARCCPTRTALLTGQYAHRAGVGHMTGDKQHPGYRGRLADDVVTIAEVLGPAGYRTGMVGKWHVTGQLRHDGDKSCWPRQRGFEAFWGTILGAGSFFEPQTLTAGNDPAEVDDTFYYTDAIGDRSAAFVRAQAASDPFFLYVAFTAPHWPLHARAADIEAQRGRYDRGWDALRDARRQKQIELGLIDADWPLTDRDPRVPPWNEAANKAWEARRMAVYAAQVVAMDRAIGRIVDALRESNRLDDTLILFLADNGGCAEELTDRWSGPFISRQTRSGEPVTVGNDPNVMPGPETTYQSYGLPWANASNTPFRLYKHYVHEGGISSPLIAHWPNGITARGQLRRTPSHIVDVMATCVAISGADYPAARGDAEVPPPAGTSLLPVFENDQLEGRDLGFEHEGNRALRRGRFKLVAKGAGSPWELYDLQVDRTETNDLANERPELTAELAKAWQDWAEQNRVLPLLGAGRIEPSKERHFELAHGANLDRYQAPDLRRRGFTFTLQGRLDGDGVLFAQGGSSHGLALYRQAAHLVFATRVGGKLTVVRSQNAVEDGPIDYTGTLAADGTITVRDRGATTVLLEGQVQLQRQHPADGLQVGRDIRGAVGRYEAPFPLQGHITRLTIDLM